MTVDSNLTGLRTYAMALSITLLSFIVGLFVPLCTSYKILTLPILSRSHVFSMTAIGEELASRGHFVHMMLAHDFPLTSDLASNQSKITVIRYGSLNYEEIVDYESMEEKITMDAMESKVDPTKQILDAMEHANKLKKKLYFFGNDQLYDEMSNFHYDIAIVDSGFFLRDPHLIPHRLRIPCISYADIINPWLIPVPWLPSFTSSKITNHIGIMPFVQRLLNTVSSVLFEFVVWSRVPGPPQDIMEKYRTYGQFDSLDELVSKSLLFISTLDPVLDEPLPSTPNVMHAGGLTIKPTKSKTLPKEFEDFIKDAKSGVIVVTFGTMTHKLPTRIAKKFSEAFSRLPDFNFIWRFTNKDNLNIPKNTMTAKWLPQNDLLADDRVKLFITHCGNNGQFEAVYHGVPMIGFPLFGDQEHNAKRIENKGYGIQMNIHEFTANGLVDNIRMVISDEKYKKRVTLASEIFRSAPRTPAERVGDAVEHVIRFGGDHLRPAGSDLALYQYLMLDILTFVLVIVILVAILIWKIFGFIIRKLFRRFKDNEKSRKVE